MNDKNLCYNCFQEKPQPGGPCPYCGFDLAENQEKFPMALKAGTLLNGRYTLGRVLGQGGFGITYVAWDEKLAARVAVKEYMPGELAVRMGGKNISVMTAARRDDFTYGQERFQEEARTLAKFMGQPNIAGVTDYFDENDTSYFVMDYIEGISFKTYIANAGGKVSVQEALDVMIPVLRALTAVHAEGFIHRDVTPDNIYITKDGNVKLLDFGSARYSLGDKSKSLDVILKVGYAPKEQYIRRGRQGPYTDVYSCAACLYAAITGYLPPESLERLDHDGLVPPSQAGAEIPLYLERAILKGLAVQPEDRFQTAGEFLEALESRRVVELPDGEAGQADEGQRAGQRADQEAAPAKKRKPLPLILAGAAALVLVFGAGTFLGGGMGGSQGQSDAANASVEDEGERENPIAEAQAPKVTIAGQEYSTAETELDLSGQGLTDADLVNLGQMENLTRLNLKGNSEISDLTPLASLTKLEVLTLPNPSAIQDMSPLSGLTNLRTLTMTGGQGEAMPFTMVKDFSPLSGLTNLTKLNLTVTELEDLSFVSGLSRLTALKLIGSVAAQDLSPLSSLTNLTELELKVIGSKVEAEDLSFASGCSQLAVLRLSNITAKDLTALSGLKNLRELEIDIDSFSSFQRLESLTGLESLEVEIGRQSDVDLSCLSGLTNLNYLSIYCSSAGSEDPVIDLTPLESLTNLRTLDLYLPQIRDLTPLASLPNLQSVTINGPENLDASPLAHVPSVNIH